MVLSAGYVPIIQGPCLEVECLPILSYHREENVVERIRQHPETHRFSPFTATEKVDTPAGFGEPISVGGYVNDRPLLGSYVAAYGAGGCRQEGKILGFTRITVVVY